MYIRRTASALAALACVSGLLAIQPQPAFAQGALVRVDVSVVGQGFRASDLRGKDVVNDKNEKIGEIDDLIISPDGRTLFAVLQVGSFLGIGGRLVAVPFQSLQMSEKDVTLPGATRDELNKLTEFKYLN